MLTFLVRFLLFEVLTTQDPRNRLRGTLALAMQSNNASQRHYGFLNTGVETCVALAYAADDESEYESKACDEQAGAR
jgi:hypothetical protein